MELELNRIEYCSVGTVLPNAMKLLPNAYKQQQRIAVGDQDGILQVFSIKREEIQIHFKTLPAEKIQSLQLSGSPSDRSWFKIFTASDNKVRAFNKKGKVFLSFDTNMTEPIKSMFVSGNDLIVCGNHVYNHYRECKDIGSYLCGDTIVDVVALCPHNSSRIITALACSSRVIRLLEHCRVRQSIELESVPTILHVPNGLGNRLICGMADGRVVLLKVTHLAMDVKEEVLVNDPENTVAVTAIDTYDLCGEGRIELILGRRDGTVQVYSLPSDDNMFDAESRLIYTENFGESISSIQGGCVSTEGYTEIVVCTYAGRIFGLSTQVAKLTVTDGSSANNITNVDSALRLEKLREEIREIEQKVQKERERYKMSTQSMSAGLSAIPMISMNDTMVLSQDGSYTLSIELPAPIEFVLLQSDVPVELLDIDKNSAVVSLSKSDPMAGNHLLATYRCQIDRNRLDMKFRTVEGQQGTLQAFITPNIQPKVSQMRSYPIRPLSLHVRMHTFDETRPLNLLTLKGSFSHAEIHNWIKNCVPEVPDKLQVGSGERSVLYFKNVFSGTSLACEYCKGQADFKTENVSTISILKDFITKEATKKRVKLEISNNIDPASIPFMIKLIEPDIVKHSKVKEEYVNLMGLVDLDIRNEEELSCLNDNYKSVMERRDEIIEAYKHSPAVLDKIYGLLTDCFVDYNKLRGINVKLKGDLINLLQNYDYGKLVNFYIGDYKNTNSDM